MLPLLLILTGLGRLASAGHHSETSLLQITVPRKTERNTKDGSISETHVTYSIQIAKKTYTLPLEKQSFLDSNFLVYSHNKSGMLYPDSSFIKKDSGVMLKRVLKICVIMDKALYDYMGSEVAIASEKIIYIFSLINTMYSQLQVSVMLTSLEIWSDRNKISTDGDAHDVLQRFVSWRETFLLQRSHDLAYLLVYRDHPTYVGATYHGMACDPKFAAGLVLSCEHLKCCDPSNCALLGNAFCGSGPCCGKKTCMLLDRGILCRKSIDPCDFPEFCNGMSEFCVPDMKAADLQTCNNKSSYCFGGVCQDRTKQCEDLFGKFAKESTYQCTQEVNFQQDKFGNCNGRSCTFSQVLCGKLVCHWTHSLIVPRDDMDIQYTYLGGHICMSADIRGHVYPDPTIIKNGTMCDENKVCNSRLNCHCDAGYVPPDCVPTSSSPGGSVDDGFWNIGSRKAKITDLIKRRGVSQKNNLMISVYIFLPFFILTAIIALKWNKMKIFWNKEGTISGDSD